MKEFVCGGLASMTATSVTHPIDLLKVRMLLYGEQQAGQTARLTLVKQVLAREGVRGMYRGLSAALTRQALFSTTRFGFYDLIKRALGEAKGKRLPYHRKVVATMMGGSIGALVACPADVMLVRMQADGRLPVEQQRGYRNVVHALYRTARDEGLRGWYRGVVPLTTRGLMVTTAQFSTYDQVKETLLGQFRFHDTVGCHFVSSLAAGLVAAVVSTPVDVIKSRMMNSSRSGQQHGSSVVYKGSLDCFRQTLRNEGVRGLYKGFLPTYMRMAPQVMIMWICVEQYRRLYETLFPSSRNEQ